MALDNSTIRPSPGAGGRETTSAGTRSNSKTSWPDSAEVKRLAAGRWGEVVARVVGFQPDGRHHHCPLPGHRDEHPSWRWDADRERWFCTCGSGDALDLVQTIEGVDFPEAKRRAAEILGLNGNGRQASASPDDFEDMTGDPPPAEANETKATSWHACKGTWNAAIDLDAPAAASARQYLKSRGLDTGFPSPEALRFHTRLPYYEKDEAGKWVLTGHYPALLALVTGPEGEPQTLHRIYLTEDGRKAPVSAPKKLMGPMPGGAIRLDEPRDGEPLVVAEGLETALAVREATGSPTWATVSAPGMAVLVLPQEVADGRE